MRSARGLHWIRKPLPTHVAPGLVADIASVTNVSSLLARSIVLRGGTTVEAAQQFLEPSWDHILPPGRMHGMPAADKRLREVVACPATLFNLVD